MSAALVTLAGGFRSLQGVGLGGISGWHKFPRELQRFNAEKGPGVPHSLHAALGGRIILALTIYGGSFSSSKNNTAGKQEFSLAGALSV